MFTVFGVSLFVVVALIFPRLALVLLAAHFLHWGNGWSLFGAIVLCIIGFVIDCANNVM